ncbi:unnamed protein product, partial [Prorocentrum cordatum]
GAFASVPSFTLPRGASFSSQSPHPGGPLSRTPSFQAPPALQTIRSFNLLGPPEPGQPLQPQRQDFHAVRQRLNALASARGGKLHVGDPYAHVGKPARGLCGMGPAMVIGVAIFSVTAVVVAIAVARTRPFGRGSPALGSVAEAAAAVGTTPAPGDALVSTGLRTSTTSHSAAGLAVAPANCTGNTSEMTLGLLLECCRDTDVACPEEAVGPEASSTTTVTVTDGTSAVTAYTQLAKGQICLDFQTYTKIRGCDGWGHIDLDTCKAYCTENRWPARCVSDWDTTVACSHVIWEPNNDHPPGWCQLASSCDLAPGSSGAQVLAREDFPAAAAAAAGAVTNTSKAVTSLPSVLCYGVYRSASDEEGLLVAQSDMGVGIFSCDGTMVFSDKKVALASGIVPIIIAKNLTAPEGTVEHILNTEIFMNAWELIRTQGNYKQFDWVVKADPDCVFVFSRLQDHLSTIPADGNQYIVNCKVSFGFFGSFEVVSRGALDLYYAGAKRCRDELDWASEGEDLYMKDCFDLLGAEAFEDFGMLADGYCLEPPSPCLSGKVAFHAMKTVGQYFQCLEEAERPTSSSETHES